MDTDPDDPGLTALAVGPAELRALLDERAIHRVLTRYATGIDRRDFAMVAACYHPGATDDHGTFKGTVEEFIPWVEGRLASFDTTMHFLGNVSIDLLPDPVDSAATTGPGGAGSVRVAHVETYCVAYHRLAGRDTDSIAGLRYIDRFECRGGEWRIADRTIVVEWNRLDDVHALGFGPEYVRGTHDRTDPYYRREAGSAPERPEAGA
ncbi:MAG: nuclear transport factor 2 family protein [Acidimicrobiales bacterium]